MPLQEKFVCWEDSRLGYNVSRRHESALTAEVLPKQHQKVEQSDTDQGPLNYTQTIFNRVNFPKQGFGGSID